jgi:hypothetical protein
LSLFKKHEENDPLTQELAQKKTPKYIETPQALEELCKSMGYTKPDNTTWPEIFAHLANKEDKIPAAAVSKYLRHQKYLEEEARKAKEKKEQDAIAERSAQTENPVAKEILEYNLKFKCVLTL